MKSVLRIAPNLRESLTTPDDHAQPILHNRGAKEVQIADIQDRDFPRHNPQYIYLKKTPWPLHDVDSSCILS